MWQKSPKEQWTAIDVVNDLPRVLQDDVERRKDNEKLMERIREYLKERNIPEDSLEANSILEGYIKGYNDALDDIERRLFRANDRVD